MPNRSTPTPKGQADRPAKIGDYPERPYAAAEDTDAVTRHHDYRPDGKPVDEPTTGEVTANG